MSHAFMMFYPGDYLRDTGHLSTEEHGAYLLLLLHAWTQGGVLPVDDELLRRITRLAPKAWAKCRALVMAFFTLKDDGYHQKRMDKELERVRAMVAKKREAVQRTQQWRATHPPQKPNGHAPPDDPPVMHNERITDAQQQHNVMPPLSAPQSEPRSQVQQEKREESKFNNPSLDSETRARGGLQPETVPDALDALLEETGGWRPQDGDPRGPCTLPEPFAAHVRRAAKACNLRLNEVRPYGEVRSLEAQAAAMQEQPQVVGADETMGLKWQPAEPERSAAAQIAALLAAATPDQIARAERYAQRAAAYREARP